MSTIQFDVNQILLAIEELFESFRTLPQESRAIIWAKIRIKLLEEFKDFIIQESDINEDTVIEISYKNTDLESAFKNTNTMGLPFDLTEETEDFYNKASLENQAKDLFPCPTPTIIDTTQTDNTTLTIPSVYELLNKDTTKPKERTRLVCNYCGKQYDGKKLFKKHLQRHENERNFECAYCSLRFVVKDDLIKHLKTHSSERNFQCSICSKKLVNKTTLRNHMSVVHNKNEKYWCQKCNYFTFSNHTLKEHIRIKHDRLFTKYACVICKRVFDTQVMLKEHLRSHTGEKPYQCKLCAAAFICSGRLTNHMNSVHGEKKFPCDMCEKSFKTSHKLKRHRLIHTRIKPFSCPFCSNYASNTQGNLTKHVKTVHQMNDFSYLRYKKMLLGQTEDVQDEWIKNAESFTNEYLKNLSNDNQTLTVEQLKEQYQQQKKNKTIVKKDHPTLDDVENLLIDIDNNGAALMLS